MRRIARITTLFGILVCGPIGVMVGQSSKPESEGSVADSALTDTTGQKKSGGVLGKVKGVANNKVVQQVAKTAACTMLPGGQVVAGAIDAAANKDAVAGAAGAATGTTCMPGMGGAGAMAGGVMAGGAMPGSAGMSAAAMAAGVGAPPSGMDPATIAAYNAQMMAMMQASMARTGQAGQMPVMPGMAGPGNTAGLPGEAEGRELEVSSHLLDELRKGKSAVRYIDWIAGTPSMSAVGSAAFAGALGTIAAAMRQVGGSYRLDLYMDKRYDETAVAALGQQRLSTVQMMLFNAGGGTDPNGMPQSGKTKRDGDPRLEIVKIH